MSLKNNMIRSEFLPFSRPSITEAEIAQVSEVLRSGWITTGAKNGAFEKAFSDYTGAAGSVALASATAGMHLIFNALELQTGDEVITPAMTWVSTANLIVKSGATPVFVDIDRDNLMTTADLIRPQITPKTKAIISVHFAGASLDLNPLRKLAAEFEIPLIEDAAHAVGTSYHHEKIGKNGTAIFSFHPIKNMTTGEGGMFCSDHLDLIEKIRRLKFHGLGVDAFDRQMQGRSPQAEVLEAGFKYNLTDIAATLGISQLQRLDQMNQQREKLAQLYLEKLADMPEILPLSIPTYPMKHSWHLFIVRLDIEKAQMSRDEFMAKLKEQNIGTGLHFKAVHLHKFYREQLGFQRGLLPNTEWNSDRICSLPLFPDMTENDLDDVILAIKRVLQK
ncbi:MAG: UDP-4-amino-4-deoxy-L-arabinose aminotransferase [Pseudomonadota bacterium]